MGIVIGCCLLLASAAHADKAWVKDDHQVNVRSGAGVEFRVVGTIVTGDLVEILERGDGWTHVQPETAPAGWIRSGYLMNSPPARLLLAEVQAENARLTEQLANVAAEDAALREQFADASQRDAAQQAEIDRLTRENIAMRAGERWPEWLTGAGIVLLGMLLGAMVARGSGRRRQQRIKL